MAKVTPEFLALDKTEGPPLDVLRKVLDVLDARYEIPTPEKDRGVAYEHRGIRLDPFLESNSIVFSQEWDGLTFIVAIEQLTKVKCIAFRTQLNRGDRIITKSDLLNDAPDSIDNLGSGRILVRARGKTLYLLFAAKPSVKTGQCEASVTLSDCLTRESQMEQTLDIHLSYKGDDPWRMELVGQVHVWHW